MQKHVLDRPAAPSQVAPGRMIAIKRNALPRKASLSLQRRPRVRSSAHRALYFLRFARA